MSNDSTTVVKRTIRRTVVSSASDEDLGGDGGATVKHIRHYQVYRGMSPASASRIDNKIRELEEAYERERVARIRAEKELSEVTYQLDSLNERLEQADGLTSAQSEISRRREQEIQKLKKDFELFVIEHETTEASQRKRYQETINELSEQIEHLQRNKAKGEKDKQVLVVEIETLTTALDAANKGKVHAESKLEGLEDQIRRLKVQVEELTRQNHELNGLKAKLSHENFELHRQVQDLDRANAELTKLRVLLQQQLDDAKSKLDEESRIRNQLTIQLTNLQVDFDNLRAHLEEETDSNGALKGQLQRAQADYQALKSKYDKEVVIITEELEETRRKFTARLAELEDLVEQARAKAAKLEKDKSKLQIDLRDTTVELETVNANFADVSKRLKHAEHLNGELQRRIDELTADLANATGENQRLLAELTRLRVAVKELQDRIDSLARENKQLSDALRDALSQNKDLTVRVQELTALRAQLEAEKDALANQLADANDALKDALSRLEAANNQLLQLRADLERRLREKDDEIDNIRKANQRAIEELQRTILEIESKYKSEISRIKKKYEVDIREFEIQIEALNRTNAELQKANKSIAGKIKELELLVEEEHRAGDDARQAAALLERKRIALSTELDDIRALLDNSERARKHAEAELHETTTRVSELTVTINNITADRRRHEGDVAALQADLDEAIIARRAAEDRADRAQNELARLIEELKTEQENYRLADGARKQLEVEIRQLAVRLEQAETFAQREGKKLVDKLQARLRELEAELEAEQRKARDLAAENRKLARLLQEQKTQSDEDRRVAAELNEQVNALNLRIKALKRQLEEAEEVVAITMNKYRKACQLLEECERHTQHTDSSTTVVHGGATKGSRSMSVTREVTRVVRV